MPELPEVECIARTLRPHLEGACLRRVRILSPSAAAGGAGQLEGFLRDRRILGVRRRGKFLLLEMGGGFCAIHLRMTGKLVWNRDPGHYTRAVFELDNGRLLLDDIRRFARIYGGSALPEPLARLGPEPLEITSGEFRLRLAGRRGRIKPLLLDQRFLAGLGNIYADEALHRAGLHPLTPAHLISGRRAEALLASIVEVLREAIEAGGSSISDYVDGEGRSGRFQLSHRVYGREGKPCPTCGAPVRRIVVAQRGTHFCPRCQRRR
ncbi:MAG: bifunctional DNA-formamidopyrimidine glycosylase/DNA-(apurinic or apyrimidinic site) lyase [Bryobacteraceae bacterium]|jgi:formamidopyrimidine-DNA glycosylase